MSTDYTKKRNAELEDLLKSRSLPHTGKKADLVARLQQYDADQASSKPSTNNSNSAASSATVTGAITTTGTAGEDEIDWEDDAAAATDPPGAAAIAAGGLTQPPNPTAVPNQIVDTDPATTSDLKIDNAPPNTTTSTETPSSEPTKPALSANLTPTTLDSELEKRQKRAARFGVTETSEDALKAIERAKKFGTGDKEDRAAVKGLDEALPEKRLRREGGGGGGRRGGGRNARSGGRDRGGTPKDGVRKTGSGGGGYGERDRQAAEARRNRFR